MEQLNTNGENGPPYLEDTEGYHILKAGGVDPTILDALGSLLDDSPYTGGQEEVTNTDGKSPGQG